MIKIKNFLFGLVVFTFIFQAIKFYSFYLEYSDWQYADWIINYQGGFIRRGFIGEILFNIHNFSTIRLDYVILAFVILLYIFVAYILIKSIKYIHQSYINILIFLSPGFFIYPIMNSEIIGRKDILLIAIFGIFVFFEKKFKDTALVFLLIFSITLLVLSHSGFLFYTPYLIFLYILIKSNRAKQIKFLEISGFFLLLLTLLLLIYFNQGSMEHVEKICLSTKMFVKENCGNTGQLFWIGNDAQNHIAVQVIKSKHLFIYLLSLVLVYIFLGIKLFNSRFKIKSFKLNKINPLIIFCILFIFSMPIYYLGTDWGRYIFNSYVCSFFIFLYCLKENLLNRSYKLNFKKGTFIVLLFFYSFFWTFPFYHPENFKFTFKKPLLQLQKRF